ncbi:hypothetical protein HaLaN_01689 [Haematococcus lacustris]|uniref:Uncharacterized protein n=1 Tax=Haematococcus lacustris TaxID=44745 RepID=A0A699YC63_HAELA|nr:hypothetical protein HaLaN_01689 [Haematococcus lacustris]
MPAKRTKAVQAAEPIHPAEGTVKGKALKGEQVAPTRAVLVARPGSSASQGQGVPKATLQAAVRPATQGPAAAAARWGTVVCAPLQVMPTLDYSPQGKAIAVAFPSHGSLKLGAEP